MRRIQCALIIGLLLAVLSSNSTAGTNGTWIDTTSGGLWSNPANWSGSTIADGIDSIADFSTLDIIADSAVHLDSARTVGTLLFGDTTPSNNWTLDNNGFSFNVLTLGVSSATPLIQVNNESTTISGVVAGTNGFMKNGNGNLILSGTNTLSGIATVSAGIIRLGSANALQNATAAVNVDGGLAFTPSIGTFTLGGLSGSNSLSLADTAGAAVTLQVGKNNTSTTFAGVASGPGSLVKLGSGTLTLNAANTFSGTATVSAGSLQLGVANSLESQTVVVNSTGLLKFSPSIGTFMLGGLSGTHGFSLTDASGNPVTLQIGGNNAGTTFSGSLSGTGSLTKVGTGTLTLTGSDSYTGSTIVSAGAIDGSLPNSTVTPSVDGGLQFSASHSTYQFGGLSGPGNLALPLLTSGATTLLVGNNNASTSYSGVLSGPGSLNKQGSGTLTLSGVNTFSGNTTVGAGVLQLSNANALQNSTVLVEADSGLQFSAGVNSVTLGELGGNSNFALTDANGVPVALQVGNNGANSGYTGVMSGAGSLTKIGAGTFALNAFISANSYTGGTFVNSGTLALSVQTSSVGAVNGLVTVNGGTVLLSTATAGKSCSVSVNVDGGLSFTSSVHTFTLGGLLGSNNFALVDSNGASITLSDGSSNASTTYSGVMSGSGGLTKTGTGILTLTSAQTYTGTTTITAGSLELANPNALQNSTVVSNVNGGLSFAPSIGTFTIGGLSAGAFGFSLTDLSGAPIVLQVGSDNSNTTSNGGLTGSGGLNKVGTGTLTLSGANTFTGDTSVSAGSLFLTIRDALENSTYNSVVSNGLTFSTALGGVYRIGGLSGTADLSVPAGISLSVGNNNASTLFSGVLSGAGTLTKIGSGTLTLSGTCTLSGGVTVNLGAVELGAANALQSKTADIEGNGGLAFASGIGVYTIGGLGLPAGFVGNQGVNFALTDTSGTPVTLQIGSDNANTTYWGAMSGAGSLTKIGTGTLTLKGANTFSGNTTISAGAIQLANVNALQNSTVVVNVNNGLTLGSNSTFSVGGLSGTGNVALSINSALSVGGDNADTSYSGVISDLSSFNYGSVGKNGTGTLMLAGANTYHGFTTINAGVVQLGNAIAVQNSFVAVNANGGLAFSPGIGTFAIDGLSGTGNFALTDTSGAPVNLQVNNNEIGIQFGNLAYSGTMSGSGSLTQVGPSGLILGGANTFTGPTNLSGGFLELTNSNALQNSTLIFSGGNLIFNTSFPTPQIYTIGGLAGSGNLDFRDIGYSGFLILNVGNNNADSTFAGSIAGSGYRGELIKIGTGTLTLTSNDYGFISVRGGSLQLGGATTLLNGSVAVNVDGGLKFSPGIGTFNVGALSGSNGFAVTDMAGAPVTVQVSAPVGFGFPGTITYSGAMSGNGGLTLYAGYLGNQSQSTLVLSGANTYTGPTTIRSGTLQVSGSLANNGSSNVFVSAGSDFTSADIIRRVPSDGSYDGMGSTASGTVAGLLGSSADIRAGQNNGASPIDLAMQWRVRGAGDGPRVLSDVLNLIGMSAATGTHVQVDPFALQMTYSPAALGGADDLLASEGLLVLGWLDPSMNQPFGLWENATAGNFGSGLPGDVFQNVQNSWDTFAAANGITDANVVNFLGSYGVDTASHTVWAVVNHNSQFAVVPEPPTVVLVALGSLALFGFEVTRRMRRVGRLRL